MGHSFEEGEGREGSCTMLPRSTLARQARSFREQPIARSRTESDAHSVADVAEGRRAVRVAVDELEHVRRTRDDVVRRAVGGGTVLSRMREALPAGSVCRAGTRRWIGEPMHRKPEKSGAGACSPP